MKYINLIKYFLILIICIFCVTLQINDDITISKSYSFEFFNKHFNSFTKHGKILKNHKYYRLNRAEENMMRKTKHININNKDVFYNDNLFDNNTKDAFGVTNCVRMTNGRSPIAKDGIEVQLHHLQQRDNGIIIETDSTFHRKFTKDLHSYKTESEIDRRSFENWKRGYWQERGKMRCK